MPWWSHLIITILLIYIKTNFCLSLPLVILAQTFALGLDLVHQTKTLLVDDAVEVAPVKIQSSTVRRHHFNHLLDHMFLNTRSLGLCLILDFIVIQRLVIQPVFPCSLAELAHQFSRNKFQRKAFSNRCKETIFTFFWRERVTLVPQLVVPPRVLHTFARILGVVPCSYKHPERWAILNILGFFFPLCLFSGRNGCQCATVVNLWYYGNAHISTSKLDSTFT